MFQNIHLLKDTVDFMFVPVPSHIVTFSPRLQSVISSISSSGPVDLKQSPH